MTFVFLFLIVLLLPLGERYSVNYIPITIHQLQNYCSWWSHWCSIELDRLCNSMPDAILLQCFFWLSVINRGDNWNDIWSSAIVFKNHFECSIFFWWLGCSSTILFRWLSWSSRESSRSSVGIVCFGSK